MKRISYIILAAVLLLSGCGATATQAAAATTDTAAVSAAPAATALTATADTGSDDTLFTKRDLSGSYDAAEAVSILLQGDSATANAEGVSVDGSLITISAAGAYVLSGSLNNGTILVDAPEDAKVQLVLSGATVTAQDNAAIYVKQADKVFLTLAEGTENTLANGGDYSAAEEGVDAAVFSRCVLTLNGSGNLTVNAASGHGIVCKDDLVITGGSYTLTAAGHGMEGKDSLAVCGGSLTITAGGGSAAVTMKTADSMGGFHGTWGAWGDAQQADTDTADTPGKGLKSDGSITITGGSFLLDTADDALHAGGDLSISGGSFDISTADDALHADGNVLLTGGSFSIPYCYEGVEGLTITLEGGEFDITATDDGFNAADPTQGETTPGAANTSSYIIVNGGTVSVTSGGDCFDSNGDLTLNGGTLNLVCNGNGNTALDCDGTFTNNGGDVTTNDGSENGAGDFGNFGGFGGNQGGRGGNGGQQPGGFPGGNQGGPGAAAGTPPQGGSSGGNGTTQGGFPGGNVPDATSGATPEDSSSDGQL